MTLGAGFFFVCFLFKELNDKFLRTVVYLKNTDKQGTYSQDIIHVVSEQNSSNKCS